MPFRDHHQEGSKQSSWEPSPLQLERVLSCLCSSSKFGSGSSEDQFFNGAGDPIRKSGLWRRFDGSPVRSVVMAPVVSRKSNVRSSSARKKRFWNTGLNQPDRPVFSAGDFYLSFQNVDIKGVMPKDVNRSRSPEFCKRIQQQDQSYLQCSVQENYNVNAGNSFGNGRDQSLLEPDQHTDADTHHEIQKTGNLISSPA